MVRRNKKLYDGVNYGAMVKVHSLVCKNQLCKVSCATLRGIGLPTKMGFVGARDLNFCLVVLGQLLDLSK